jgi:hypothetical protein
VSDTSWSVVNNGLDFLESAVDHLASGNEHQRHLRYAALHLTAAIETLLKAQLAREHWAFVVGDIDSAKRTSYDTGDFRSVNITTALHRLNALTGSSVTGDEIERIRAVEKLRNRVAHFAPGDEDPRRTQATLARGLDALLGLIDREFVPEAQEAEADLVRDTLGRVRDRLGKIEALIRERMNTLQPILAKVTLPVLTCPGCSQPAFVLEKSSPARCLYCFYDRSGDVCAEEYVAAVLRKRDPDAVIHHCVECSSIAFVAGVLPVDGAGDEGKDIWACFACSFTCTGRDLDDCAYCDDVARRVTDSVAECPRCLKKRRANEMTFRANEVAFRRSAIWEDKQMDMISGLRPLEP